MRLRAIECPVCNAPLDFTVTGQSLLTHIGHLTIELDLSAVAMEHLRSHTDEPGSRGAPQ